MAKKHPKGASKTDYFARTGIAGLDSLMGGGFEAEGTNLIRGSTGSGKTLFCLQSLVSACDRYDECGAFISFEESKESVYRSAKGIGCDLSALEKKGKFVFARYSPHEVAAIIKEGGGMIRDSIEAVGAKRVAIDSLTAYSLLFETPYESNEGLLALFEILNRWKVTTLLTDEKDVDISSSESGRLGFLSDSIIHLYNVRTGQTRARAMEVVKMRHAVHSNKLIPFKIEKRGIVIYPDMQLLV
ncbi:MAG: ATPase domain-containing protein [Candidatus Micrarchaeota archaeon]